MVVPVKELPGEVPGVFDRVEPFGDSGAVFEGLELRLRVRIVAGGIGSGMGLRWTPSFGQPGSEVKVDSTGFVRLPFSIECIPPWVSCHR